MKVKAMEGLNARLRSRFKAGKAGYSRVGMMVGSMVAVAASGAHATGNFSGSANTIPDLTGTFTSAHDTAGAAIETYGPALAGILFLFLMFRFVWSKLKGSVH